MFRYAIGKNGHIIPIDFKELQSSDRLQGATIFNRLFCLDLDTPFKSEEIESLSVDENGNITLLRDFNITTTEWIKFMYFIRNGTTPFILLSSTNTPFLQELERLSIDGVFGIFGPIPSFDKYYTDTLTVLKQEKPITPYNPMTPEKDIEKKYRWKTGNGITLNIESVLLWSYTIPVRDCGFFNPIMYMRKLVE